MLALLLVCSCGTIATVSGQTGSRPGTAPATTTSPASPSSDATQQQTPSGTQSGVVIQSGAAATAAGGTQDSSQGRQFGQPGFVGEPININVVNADIRDILNYITEQYGVNFVIDSSVGAIPVTINVTDVPWNQALEAVLKANRLGIDVSGSILRLATIQVLATEAAAQERIREAQLNNAPLVTEIIPLNYARAVGTLAQAAGTTGSFAGGSSVGSFSGGTGGDFTGQSGDVGILPIISRRLSRRGSVEVDGRGNRLIVTDVRDNIEAVRRLIDLLDQPEPQVEIETRIVIANRNFVRDLGVQLAASVFNSRTGAGATGTTLPNGVVNNTVPGLINPLTNLGAAGATTVIGLTTGIFGTAQISAAITAAETKGQIKTVATPRITALNNRTAQVETGSQIPVVTPQISGGGGAAGGLLLTTSFVSVPLRLSVTPQISNADTVILRVVAENNSINTTISAAGGTPGIDSQRMQTEVLVPDGGTTVVGGAIQDVESNRQDRTPGLSGIPIVGNLFKRRLVRRDSAELLFFITPRIYRPDYNGRPLPPGSVGPRQPATIQQPVPLGNPQSNTPAPAGQQLTVPSPQPIAPMQFGPLGVQPAQPATTQPATPTPQAAVTPQP